jgi:hypothetical protein
MQPFHLLQVVLERVVKDGGQHRDPVLLPLSVADDELLLVEIEVLFGRLARTTVPRSPSGRSRTDL